MITIIMIMFIMFLVIAIVPFSQWIYFNIKTEKTSGLSYMFEQNLLDFDLDAMRIEDVSNQKINLEQMKNRSSVRIAQGLVLAESDVESRKQKEYAIELP